MYDGGGKHGITRRLALIGPVGPTTGLGYKKSMIELYLRINRHRGLSSDLITTISRDAFEEDGNRITPIRDISLHHYHLALISGLWFPSVLSAARILCKQEVPYLVSARGALSSANLKQSWYKKIPFLAFGGLNHLRNAEGVHYLTQEEKRNSWFVKRPVFISNTLRREDFTGTQDVIRSKSNEIVFGFVGRYAIHHKGLDRMLQAFAKLFARKPEAPVQLILHGQGEDRTRVERMVGRLGLNDVVDVRGAIQGADKTAFLQECDVFCHTSRYEGQPQAVMEAMAASCAVLVTPGANMAEYVTGYDCGAVSDGSPTAIAEAMHDLVNDRERLHSMGQRARTAAEESFEPSRLDHELDALLPFMTGSDDQSG